MFHNCNYLKEFIKKYGLWTRVIIGFSYIVFDQMLVLL